MEQTNLAKDLTGFGFSGKYILRKTGEEVEVIAFNNPENGARTAEDWVSYIDADGGEHIKERLNIQFDFKTTSGMSSLFERLLNEMPKTDLWEPRRYELVKEMVVENGDDPNTAIEWADEIIAALKKSPEAPRVEMDDGYENIGIGEIVESIDGSERLKKFVFTDRKDIVGFRGDNGRWDVGDRVKVYIKRLKPQEEERPVP